MQTKKITRPGISSNANIITALRTMKGKLSSPNMGSATSNRYVAPTAPKPAASEALPGGTNPAVGTASTSEISLSLAQIGQVQPGDRVSITISRVEGGMAFGRPTISTGSPNGPAGPSMGSNLAPKILGGQ